MEANRGAPAFAEHEIYVEASPHTVWAVMSDVDSWSSWQPDIGTANLNAPLSPGSTFKWKSGGTGVSSTLQDVEPPRRLAWTGTAAGARAKHVWMIEPQGSGTLVRTQSRSRDLSL